MEDDTPQTRMPCLPNMRHDFHSSIATGKQVRELRETGERTSRGTPIVTVVSREDLPLNEQHVQEMLEA